MTTDALRGETLGAIAAAQSPEALEAVRVAVLGKAGSITQLMKSLGGLAPDERLKVAPVYQALREEVSAALDAYQSFGQQLLDGLADGVAVDGKALGQRLFVGQAALQGAGEDFLAEGGFDLQPQRGAGRAAKAFVHAGTG